MNEKRQINRYIQSIYGILRAKHSLGYAEGESYKTRFSLSIFVKRFHNGKYIKETFLILQENYH